MRSAAERRRSSRVESCARRNEWRRICASKPRLAAIGKGLRDGGRRLKEREHFALVNDQYYLSVALFNAKSLGLAQVCVR